MLRTVCSNTSVLIGTRLGGPVVPLVRMWMPASLSIGSRLGPSSWRRVESSSTRGSTDDNAIAALPPRRAASATGADQSSRSATTAASRNASTSAAIDRADW